MAKDAEIIIPDSYTFHIKDLLERGYRFMFLTSNGGYTVTILAIKDRECEDREVNFTFSEIMQGREYMYEKLVIEARDLVLEKFEKEKTDERNN